MLKAEVSLKFRYEEKREFVEAIVGAAEGGSMSYIRGRVIKLTKSW
jgi:hypothetical protein